MFLAGGGRFGENVLWAGVGGDVDGLRRPAEAVRRSLQRARVVLDRHDFQPHLTLARPRGRVNRDELRADVDRLRSYVGPRWDADRLHLVRSTRDRTGVTYEPLDEWVLPYQE